MTDQLTSRGNWGSRIGFILAAAGSAVGLGAIWKFPYVAGANGGGVFLLVYLACVFSVGVVMMLAEMMIGRSAKKISHFGLPGTGARQMALGRLDLSALCVLNPRILLCGRWLDHRLHSRSYQRRYSDHGRQSAQ